MIYLNVQEFSIYKIRIQGTGCRFKFSSDQFYNFNLLNNTIFAECKYKVLQIVYACIQRSIYTVYFANGRMFRSAF